MTIRMDYCGVMVKDDAKSEIAETLGIPVLPKNDFSIRNEPAWKIKTLDEWNEKGGCLVTTEAHFKKAEEHIEVRISEVSKLSSLYVESTKKLRDHVKNDAQSIAAASDKLSKEVAKSISAYKSQIDLWNSEEMERAIKNAERMVSALSAISEIRNTPIESKISFSFKDTE